MTVARWTKVYLGIGMAKASQTQGWWKCTLRYSRVDSNAQLWFHSSPRWTKVYLAIFMCRFECTTIVPFKCKVDESVPCDIHVSIRVHNYGTAQVQGGRKCTLRYSCVDSSAQLWYHSNARWTKVYHAIFMCGFDCTTMVPFKCKVDESVPWNLYSEKIAQLWYNSNARWTKVYLGICIVRKLHNYGTIQMQGGRTCTLR